MVDNAKGDVRQPAEQPDVADLKAARAEVVVDDRQPTEDQVAAAAAATDAEQPAAVEVVAEAGILPTEAPIQSIGEVAQAPAPATTTTPTPAPADAGGTTEYNPWLVGGAAVLGIGAIAAVANDDDDDNPAPPPAGEEPPPAPPPGGEEPPPPPPPANVAPTSENTDVPLTAPQTPLSADLFPFSGPEPTDTLAAVTIASVTPTVAESPTLIYDEISGHAYQFVSGPTISWADANAAAVAAGGHLLVIDSAEELALIRDGFATATPSGLGGPLGSDGTWIGLSQAAGQTGVGDGWSWISNQGAPNAGLPFSGTDAFWNTGEPNDANDVEDGQDDWGAIYQGLDPTDTKLIFDWDATGLPNYIIEYESALTLNGDAVPLNTPITVDQLGSVTWNSVFNSGGALTFTVTDSAGLTSAEAYTMTFSPVVTSADPGSSLSVASLVEDQHLNVLA